MTQGNYDEWLQMYNDQKASGLSIRAWGANNNISIALFHYRVSVLRKKGLIETPFNATTSNFVEIKASENEPITSKNSLHACSISLPNGISIGISNDISPSLFNMIMEITTKC